MHRVIAFRVRKARTPLTVEIFFCVERVQYRRAPRAGDGGGECGQNKDATHDAPRLATESRDVVALVQQIDLNAA